MAQPESYSLREQAIFVFGTGLAIGLQVALIHVFLFRLWRVLPITLASTLAFCSATMMLWHWVLPRTGGTRAKHRLALQLLIATAVFTVVSVAFTEANALVGGTRSLFTPYSGGDRIITVPAYMFRWSTLVYTLIPIGPASLICVVGFNQHWWRILMLEGRQRELHNLAVSAQLTALRAQVNPHFFFNSLNSIAQLISTDPEKAERCVERLADIYRYILSRSQAEFVPLAEELEVAEAYLEIEKARFGEDLKVEERIDERARSMRLPGLILQPLVENAVKHGISRKIGGGTVTIDAGVEDGHLRLTVRDTGVGIQEREHVFERGVGLRVVHDRLVNLYGPQYVPLLESSRDGGTSVTVRIPASPQRAAA